MMLAIYCFSSHIQCTERLLTLKFVQGIPGFFDNSPNLLPVLVSSIP